MFYNNVFIAFLPNMCFTDYELLCIDTDMRIITIPYLRNGSTDCM